MPHGKKLKKMSTYNLLLLLRVVIFVEQFSVFGAGVFSPIFVFLSVSRSCSVFPMGCQCMLRGQLEGHDRKTCCSMIYLLPHWMREEEGRGYYIGEGGRDAVKTPECRLKCFLRRRRRRLTDSTRLGSRKFADAHTLSLSLSRS